MPGYGWCPGIAKVEVIIIYISCIGGVLKLHENSAALMARTRCFNYTEPQFLDSGSQGIPIDPKQIRCLDLIAAGRRQRGVDKRYLYLLYDAVIQAIRRQVRLKSREVLDQVVFHELRQGVVGTWYFVIGR